MSDEQSRIIQSHISLELSIWSELRILLGRVPGPGKA